MEKISPQIVDSMFGGENATAPENIDSQVKVTLKDEDGKIIAQGSTADDVLRGDWVARVSSMSLSVKVTPKVADTFISVERALTVDVNTLDKEKVHGIWKNLQEQVVSGTFNTLTMVVKQLADVKKSN